jgi:NADPH:quinone reductase-like Zn-dependent oxidoreductase
MEEVMGKTSVNVTREAPPKLWAARRVERFPSTPTRRGAQNQPRTVRKSFSSHTASCKHLPLLNLSSSPSHQMSFAGKVVVVFGATGVVGSGAANAFLNEGATVLAVGRDLSKLQALKGKVEKNANLHFVTGDYTSEAVTKKLHEDIKAALAGTEIDRT